MNNKSIPKYKVVKKGEIYYADLGTGMGSEQSGIRPVVIIQNDIGNKNSPTTIVATITSINKKMYIPVHIKLYKEFSNLPKNSVILLEQIRTIDKTRLLTKISSIHPSLVTDINSKLKISLAI